VRVSEGSFHEKQSAMPRTAGVSGNVPEEKGIKKMRVARWTARKKKWKLLIEIQHIKQHFVTKTVTCLFPVRHR